MRRPQQKRNGRWCLRWWQAGKLVERSFPTRKEADAFAKLLATAESDKGHFERMLLAGKAIGVEVPQERPGTMKFEELVAAWEESRFLKLRPSTRKDYRGSLKRLTATFTGRELRSIKPPEIERFRNELISAVASEQLAIVERKLSRIEGKDAARRSEQEVADYARAEELRSGARSRGVRCTGKALQLVKALWDFAVAREFTDRNPAAGVEPPVAERPIETDDVVIDANILTPAEIERLLGATPEEHRCAVRFLFMTGVRFGELRGLMWTDFDWGNSRVRVRRQRSEYTRKLTETKTKAGPRWIDLDSDLITDLKRLKLRSGAGEFPFHFDPRNWRTRVWARALRAAGLRHIRVHDARHTHASLLIGAGADVVSVSRRLGHSKPSVTLDIYSHAFERRAGAGLGAQLAEFMKREQNATSAREGSLS